MLNSIAQGLISKKSATAKEIGTFTTQAGKRSSRTFTPSPQKRRGSTRSPSKKLLFSPRSPSEKRKVAARSVSRQPGVGTKIFKGVLTAANINVEDKAMDKSTSAAMAYQKALDNKIKNNISKMAFDEKVVYVQNSMNIFKKTGDKAANLEMLIGVEDNINTKAEIFKQENVYLRNANYQLTKKLTHIKSSQSREKEALKKLKSKENDLSTQLAFLKQVYDQLQQKTKQTVVKNDRKNVRMFGFVEKPNEVVLKEELDPVDVALDSHEAYLKTKGFRHYDLFKGDANLNQSPSKSMGRKRVSIIKYSADVTLIGRAQDLLGEPNDRDREATAAETTKTDKK